MSSAKQALRNCTILDGTKDMQPQAGMTVLVENDRIAALLQDGEPVPAGYAEKDLAGAYLMPGLINLHAHLFGTGKPSKTLGGGSAQKAILAFAKTGLGMRYLDSMAASNVRTQLRSGVTTLRTVGDFRYADVHARDAVNAGKIEGPRMYVSGPAMTVWNGHGAGTFAEVADTPEEFRALVRNRIKNKVDFIKICTTGGVMDSTVEGEAGLLRMNVDQTKAVCDEAHAHGLKVASHTESPEGLEVDLLGGVDTVEHGCAISPQMEALYKKNGAANIATVSVAVPLSLLDASVTMLNPVSTFNSKVIFERTINGAKDAIAKDIPLGMGTDVSCPFITHYDTWRELYDFVKFLEVTPQFTLHIATLANARILGIEGETGSVEVGKCADLIATHDNPLEDIRALRKVSFVMARGAILSDLSFKRLPQVDAVLDGLM